MYRDDLYMLSFKHEGSMYLLMTPQGGTTPYLDPHEDCALKIIDQIYSACLASPVGPAMVQKGDFEVRILKHEFDREDEGVYAPSLIEWLKEVQNDDAVPDVVRGIVQGGALMQICRTPAGLLMGIPLKEELIAINYCADEKSEAIKRKLFMINCN